MISPPMSRTDVIRYAPPLSGLSKRDASKTLSAFIRQCKADGRMIERRIHIEPKSPRKRVVYHWVATNLPLFD